MAWRIEYCGVSSCASSPDAHVAGSRTGAFAAGKAAAAQKAEDILTVAVAAEPEMLLPRNACSTSANFVSETVYDPAHAIAAGRKRWWLAGRIL